MEMIVNELTPGGLDAAALRTEFDRQFELPEPDISGESQDFLGIRIANSGYAIRISDLEAIVKSATIIPLPGGFGGLLGIACIRGRLVPVFRLDETHKQPSVPVLSTWVALFRGPDLFGLAFETLDGFFPVRSDAVLKNGSGVVIRVSGEVKSVLEVPELLKTIRGVNEI